MINNMRTTTISLGVLLCFVVGLNALTLSNTLGNNMVLPRAPANARLWGTDVPNSKIVVSVSDGTPVPQTTVDSTGNWSATINPHPAGGPYTIIVRSSTGNSVTLTGIMFGDVYICGGQSNMQFTVPQVFNATTELSEIANYPNIRIFSVGDSNISYTPQSNLIHYALGWSVPTSANVGYGAWTYFSAVCWLFGKNLALNFPTLPIGLISSNWGGTYIQAWSSPDALAKCPTAEPTYVHHPDQPEVNSGAVNPNQPSVLWNAMIVPFLNQPISGVVWYQGEQNSGSPAPYECQFPAMISDWRAKFGGDIFPFFFVQLAPWFPTSVSVAETRQSQLAALDLPKVGFATAVDLGDPISPFGSVHPRNKQTVGWRLVQSALNIAYGQSTTWMGPMANTASVASQAPNVIVNVSFNPATLTQGLIQQASSGCPAGAGSSCSYYVVSMSDGKTYNATAKITGTNLVSITATTPANLTVTSASYAFGGWPVTDMYNGAGFPAIPYQFQFNN